jgi:DNA-binding CsgD family transcriptional regulator
VADARHWIAVYLELLSFKRDLIERIEAEAAAMSDEANAEIIGGDLRLLQEQERRWKERIRFWYSRYAELQGLDLDPENLTATYGDQSVKLTKREFELLDYLVRHPRLFHTAEQLADRAWGNSELYPEEVRTYITRLRGHLRGMNAPGTLVNVPRQGYSWRNDEPSAVRKGA